MVIKQEVIWDRTSRLVVHLNHFKHVKVKFNQLRHWSCWLHPLWSLQNRVFIEKLENEHKSSWACLKVTMMEYRKTNALSLNSNMHSGHSRLTFGVKRLATCKHLPSWTLHLIDISWAHKLTNVYSFHNVTQHYVKEPQTWCLKECHHDITSAVIEDLLISVLRFMNLMNKVSNILYDSMAFIFYILQPSKA